MRLWKQWSRKLDGWVERRRRFQKAGAERTPGLPGEPAEKVEKVPAVLGTTIRAVPASLPDSGKAPQVPGQ